MVVDADSALAPDTALARILEEEDRTAGWLARRIGVARSVVSRYVYGIHRPSESRQQQIADVLRRTREEVFPPDEVFGMDRLRRPVS